MPMSITRIVASLAVASVSSYGYYLDEYSCQADYVVTNYPQAFAEWVARADQKNGRGLSMRLVVQRVRQASVHADGTYIAAIGTGLLVLVGFGSEDAETVAWPSIETILRKLPLLRIFPDNDKPMNTSLVDVGGEILLVSQFTLCADCSKGRRPSFHLACPPREAADLYDRVCAAMCAMLPGKVRSGIFAVDMDVLLTNWGPVTLIFDSNDM